jgi:hypothetical protein
MWGECVHTCSQQELNAYCRPPALHTQIIVEETQLFKITVSFGNVVSLISLPCYMSHASIPADVRAARGLPDGKTTQEQACVTSCHLSTPYQYATQYLVFHMYQIAVLNRSTNALPDAFPRLSGQDSHCYLYFCVVHLLGLCCRVVSSPVQT